MKAFSSIAKTLLVTVITLSLFSCGQDKPKIDYKANVDTTSVIDNQISDTTKMLVSELPIKFDSTDVVLSAIGLVDLQERDGYVKMGLGSYSKTDYSSNYFTGDKLTGNFVNIVFRDKNGLEKKLTNRKIRIRSVHFLRDIFKTTKTGYLLYSLSDRDSNRDKDLDKSDLEALYISNIDGTGFLKLTKELHELYDWSSIKGENKVYFRTLEDKNKDGELTNKDKFHYYYIDFSGKGYSVKEYDPIKLF